MVCFLSILFTPLLRSFAKGYLYALLYIGAGIPKLIRAEFLISLFKHSKPSKLLLYQDISVSRLGLAEP
jgi:hypothetical protein